ncbi:nudix family hydrolase-like protein [Plenodomus tracheiphilus IPT5]|uniref:Nudix family hydrolase-like protein n=1 Tax=Plenodomus tracheiphilus IPT5 TaxID=1408161 RepID=A0A6A7BKJ5_9PLEO|nr:nudix family hydrolase-like protein [Plenodomus tracheiphilus IPT5]
MASTDEIVAHLKNVLLELNAHPYPDVACPPNLPKRASVALILRIQPSYAYWPESPGQPLLARSSTRQRRRSSAASGSGPNFETNLNAFFDQDWVKHGDPEILFIKRAARVGDKWNGHVALPGGKRDPEDENDEVTAAREALEEVGIDLSFEHAIAVGNLPQRIVTTSWGKVPLMVLCPYIYLLTSPTYPAQRLQPTEVASSHWVPVRALLSPHLRTYEYADVSARLAKSELGIKRWFLQAMLSKMMFAAIRLVPANSTHCATIPDFIPDGDALAEGIVETIKEALGGPEARYKDRKPPLLLWGLTLGVVSDFLEHLPPHNALELWTYPTFTNWDVRFVMWAISYRFRKQRALEMSTSTSSVSSSATSEGVQDFPGIGSEAVGALYEEKPGEVGIAGLGVGRGWGQTGRAKMVARGAAVNSLLEGYYPLVRKAVAAALVGRLGVAALLAALAWRTFQLTKRP